MTETKMHLEDWLDDLCVRFIINLPREELESVERICFQVEEAQWFYEDFIRPLDPALPSLSLKAFALRIFQHCPLMSQWSHYHHITAFSEFLAYKTRVPVRGAILLSEEMDEVVLVKGWRKGANWSFPRGKINKGEKDLDCAIREVYEETGFDVRDANLVKDENDVKFIEITMREQHMRLYVFRGVPRETHFEPRTRKEISKIEWYKLSELPTLKKNKQHDEGFAVTNANKFYMVAPFLHPLKKWIAQQKKFDFKAQAGSKPFAQLEGYTSMDENGQAAGSTPALQPHAQVALPSDLPEVTSAQDASSHLKRLLNIGGLPAPAQAPAPELVQTSAVDPSKSNALLALLRSGPQEPVPQPSQINPLLSSTAARPNAPVEGPPPHLAPNFFPGFPQQQQHMGPSPFMQQTVAPFPSRPSHSNVPLSGAPQRPLGPHYSHIPPNDPTAMPHFPQQLPTPNYQPRPSQPSPYNAVPPRPAPAPFRQTGDPQFSQSAQPSQIQGATVPPASKLPPPKLTSHSLALLNVFKKEGSKTPKGSSTAVLAVPGQAPPQARKPSQHQDSLLSLLRGPRAVKEPQPVELSAHPVPPVSSEKQILHRPQGVAHNNLPAMTDAPKAQPSTTATVSGPLNLPQLEAISKPTPKKPANGSSRKNQANRREQMQVQTLSSPITILSRPQSAKRDASSPGPSAEAIHVSSPRHGSKPIAPEPVKPFQPQILRRSEKPDYDNMLMAASKISASEHKPSFPSPQTHAPELAPQGNFDRRPSQTTAQKEALLSLFGKQPGSPSMNRRSSATTGIVSPLSSLHLPSSGDSISRHGTPSNADHQAANANRGASPNNKAFLLGFLEGVAKGNK
ncbi:hypothetical protein NUU61_004044 [Penicillium alfredii]|uniref:Nudix hydrolase domain-containing protein n=1 Tax=Penicillium alfredii TaxID=1506179 RepID=A0A9W9KEA0_9EURO|nr:uncharacterized protein NUU61_004044 [Penicillium alfredii]KAJ5101822.1 hypothetical protein NUU61_004044 [Penicillium alfredii]